MAKKGEHLSDETRKRIGDARRLEWADRESNTTKKRLMGAAKGGQTTNGRRKDDPEAMELWLSQIHSPDACEKISEANRSRKGTIVRSPEYWDKWRATRADNFSDPEYKEYWMECVQSEEVRGRRSETLRDNWQDGEYRANHIQTLQDPEVRSRISRSVSALYDNEDYYEEFLER